MAGYIYPSLPVLQNKLNVTGLFYLLPLPQVGKYSNVYPDS